MVFNEVADELSDLISQFPAEVTDKMLDLIFVFKAVGIAAIVYMVYIVVMGIFTYRRMKKIEHIEKKADKIGKKVNSIDRKLDKLLKSGKKK